MGKSQLRSLMKPLCAERWKPPASSSLTRMAVDQAYVCVSCRKESSGSERANYSFMRIQSAFEQTGIVFLDAAHLGSRTRSALDYKRLP